MITVQELRRKALNFYAEVLRSEITGENIFRKIIRSNKVLSPDFPTMNEELAPLIENSKERTGYGYTILYEKRKTRRHSFQDIPSEFSFENLSDYLWFVGKESEFEDFKINLKLILDSYPSLEEWLSQKPLLIVEYNKKWPELIKVCKWFTENYEPNRYYIRELPISVHTKFIEKHKGILKNLLDELIPEKINSDGGSFEQCLGLKYTDPLIRCRFLDGFSCIDERFSDFSLPLKDFSIADIPCNKIFITENQMNFLTLPKVSNAIALWGGGFRVELLKNIEWLNGKRIYYWGDLDVQGMQILSQIREYYPHPNTIALMMDFETLNKFENDWDTGTPTNVSNLHGLNTEELELFSFLKSKNIRLEQEKIPQVYVESIFSQKVF